MIKDIEVPKYAEALQTQRIKYTAQWYENLHAYDNNHFVVLNRQVNKVQMVPIQKSQFLQLPEVSKQVDSFENILLMTNPTFTIYPNDITNVNDKAQSAALSMYLRQHYLDWTDDNIMHQYVHTACIFPEAYWVFSIINTWNSDRQKWEKSVKPIIEDGFDWLYDPRYPFEDQVMLIRILRKTKHSFRTSKLYTGFKDTGYINDFKEKFWNDNLSMSSISEDLQPAMAYEVYTKEVTKDGVSLRVKTITTDGDKIRDDLYKDLNFFPVVPVSLYSGNSYKPSFIERLLPLNRSIDLISNRIEDYMVRFSRGQFQTLRGNETDMADLNGIIHYSMEPLTAVNVPQMTQSIWQWFEMLLSLSERYGVNQAGLGLSPRGSQNRTAKQGQQSLQGMIQQQKTPLDNLYFALKKIAEMTVYFESQFIDYPKSITIDKGGQDYQSHNFIGEKYIKYFDPMQFPGLISIPKTIKKFRVEMQDSQMYTIEGKRKEILALASVIGKVPPAMQKLVIDTYDIGDTANIMKDLQQNNTLLDSPEFQNLISMARQGVLPQQEGQALMTLLGFLSKQSPVPPNLGVQSKGKKPEQGQPQGQPQQGQPQQGQPQQPSQGQANNQQGGGNAVTQPNNGQ